MKKIIKIISGQFCFIIIYYMNEIVRKVFNFFQFEYSYFYLHTKYRFNSSIIKLIEVFRTKNFISSLNEFSFLTSSTRKYLRPI